MKLSKDIPLAELTLRRYEKPNSLDRREMVRKLCLSLGLLQPADSRDVIVDILASLIASKEPLRVEQIEQKVKVLRSDYKRPLVGIAISNIRRQLRRLREIMLVEKVKNAYRLNENLSLQEIIDEKIMPMYLKSITDRIREYAKALDS